MGSEEHPYLLGKPEWFRRSADVLLVLDSGKELLAHSNILSLHSEFLCDVFTSTANNETGASFCLPFPGCSEEEANALLLHVYDPEGRSHALSIKSAQLLSSLAHKYGLDGTLRQCDDFLASKVQAEGQSKDLWVRLLAKPSGDWPV